MRTAIIDVVSAKPAGTYWLEIAFDDATVKTLDFGPFFNRSRHPDVRAYLQSELFSAFRAIYGALVRGDYDLYSPVSDLYRNAIEHTDVIAQAA